MKKEILTNETLVMVLGFTSSTLASLFAAWKGEQNIRTIALRVKEETLQVALELSKKTRRRDKRLNQKLDKNIDLTIVGNDIKSDIVKNQQQLSIHGDILQEIVKTVAPDPSQMNRLETQSQDTNEVVHKIDDSKKDENASSS